jgi:hypothetical protein
LKRCPKQPGKEISAITRDVLHAWAIKEIHASNVLQQILAREGLRAAFEGIKWSAHRATGNE